MPLLGLVLVLLLRQKVDDVVPLDGYLLERILEQLAVAKAHRVNLAAAAALH